MKKLSKMISLLLAGVMVLAMLTACAGGTAGGKVYGTFKSGGADTPDVNGLKIQSCSVRKSEIPDDCGKYTGKEIVYVTYGVVNESSQPLDMEHAMGELFSNGYGEDLYDNLFSKGSKYFTVGVNGNSSTNVFAYGLKMYSDEYADSILAPGKFTAVQVMILAPKDWKNVTVQWKPSCGKGKSVAFRFTPDDIEA